MSLPRYPEYKESGVDWLGEIPRTWKLTSLKHGYAVTLGKMLQPDRRTDVDKLLPYLRAANIQPSGVDIGDVRKMWMSPLDVKNLCLESGDLLISEGGDVGRSAIWNYDEEMYIQNSVNRVRALDNNCTKFLFYWITALKAKGFIDVLCNKSTIAHFTAEKVATVPTPFPSTIEQSLIARFLDHETAKIDVLIHEQKRLIELLKEKRQAVISHAVTKGLNPNVPMKDSGVEWLGEVPAHWTVMRLKYSKASTPDSLRAGPFGSSIKGDDFLESSNYRVYNQASIISGDFSKSAFVSSEKFEELSAFRVNEEDVLITTRGTIGRIAIAPSNLDQGVIHPCLIRLRLSERGILGEFLKITFEHTSIAIEQLRVLSNATTIDVIYSYNLEKIWLPVPPIDEQGTILEYTSKRLNQLDNLSNELARNLTLLKERRSALISAAVTGKIDVRNWQLPGDEGAFDKEVRQTGLEATV